MGNTKSVCSRCWHAGCGCSGNDAVSPVHTSTFTTNDDGSSATVQAMYYAAAVGAPAVEDPSPVQASTSTPASGPESAVAVADPAPATEEDPSPVQASTCMPASASASASVAVADPTSTSTALDGSSSTTAQPPSIAAEDPSAPPQSSTSASVSAFAVPDHALQSILDISNDGVDRELAPLIADIRILLNYAKGSPSSSLHDPKPDSKKWKFIDISPLVSLKDLFSEAADTASGLMSSDQSEALKSIVKTTLNGIGKAHWIAAGLVAVAFVIDRFDLISSNKAECLRQSV